MYTSCAAETGHCTSACVAISKHASTATTRAGERSTRGAGGPFNWSITNGTERNGKPEGAKRNSRSGVGCGRSDWCGASSARPSEGLSPRESDKELHWVGGDQPASGGPASGGVRTAFVQAWVRAAACARAARDGESDCLLRGGYGSWSRWSCLIGTVPAGRKGSLCRERRECWKRCDLCGLANLVSLRRWGRRMALA